MTDQEVRHRLGAATDTLTEGLRVAEERIGALRLGVDAEVPLTHDLTLRFGREGKSWRLTVKNEQGFRFLLLNASRELRMLAVPLLPDLVAELRKVAAFRAVQVEDRVGELRGFLDTLPPRE